MLVWHKSSQFLFQVKAYTVLHKSCVVMSHESGQMRWKGAFDLCFSPKPCKCFWFVTNVIIKESSLQTPQSSLLHVTWHSCKLNRGLTPSCPFPTNWREITTRLLFTGLKKCKGKQWPTCRTSDQKNARWKLFFSGKRFQKCKRMFNMVCQCLDSHRNAVEEQRTWQLQAVISS